MAQQPSQRLFDLHQHTPYNGRPLEKVLAHQQHYGVTTTLLLPGEGWMLQVVGDNQACAQFEAAHAKAFVRFACADPAEPGAIDQLRKHLSQGAIGIGEMKFRVAVDSPEMERVYHLADEMRVPVLLHFEHGNYNTGIERFEKVLQRYPKVNFIGHAQTWWGNISAKLEPTDMYPKDRVVAGGLTDRLLSDYPNLYGDLSAGSGLNSMTRDRDFARGFLARHRRKLIWGSDCDCWDGEGGGTKRATCLTAQSLKALRELVPDSASYRDIVFYNGVKLLGLV